MSVLNVNPAITPIFHNDTWLPLATINNRLYISDSELERDEFDNYWNDRPASMQDGNGCKGLVVAGAIALFIITLVLTFFLSSCAPKVNTPHRSVDDRLRNTIDHRLITKP